MLRTARVLQEMDDLRDVLRKPAAKVIWLSGGHVAMERVCAPVLPFVGHRVEGEKEKDDVDAQGAVGVGRDQEANAAFAKNAPVNKKQGSSGKNDIDEDDVGLSREADAAFAKNTPVNVKQGCL